MSAPPKKESSSVGWWLGWISLTIVSFFVSCYFWTGFIAEHVGSMDKPGTPVLWVTAVFGTWMVLLVPLIILMYNKVDRAYEDARIARERATFDKAKASFRVKSILLDPEKRKLPQELSGSLKHIPETLRHGHLVTAVLKDGNSVENVFILNRREVLGVYDREELGFSFEDVARFEPSDPDRLPDFKPERWLRLDGVGA